MLDKETTLELIAVCEQWKLVDAAASTLCEWIVESDEEANAAVDQLTELAMKMRAALSKTRGGIQCDSPTNTVPTA